MSDDNFLPPMACIYLIVCLNFLPLILMTSSVLTYFSLGIHFLVKDISIRNECPDSFLWEYILVCVIFTPFFYLHHFLKKYLSFSKKITFRVLIFSVFFCFIAVIYGGIGLYNHSSNCENDTSDLSKFGIASLIFQILFLIYGFVAYLDYIETIEEQTSLNIQEQSNFGSSSDEIVDGQSSPENEVFIDEDKYHYIETDV